MGEDASRFCSNCGYEHGGTTFCSRCGARQHESASAEATDAPSRTRQGVAHREGARSTDLRRLLGFGLLLLVAAIALPILSGSDGSTPTGTSATDRCEVVPPEVVARLTQGLTVEGGDVDFVRAVRSSGYEKVWFVSADIVAVGFEGADDVATWASNSIDPSDPAGFASVNDLALNHSNWADGPRSDAQLSMSDDGAAASQECTSDAARS